MRWRGGLITGRRCVRRTLCRSWVRCMTIANKGEKGREKENWYLLGHGLWNLGGKRGLKRDDMGLGVDMCGNMDVMGMGIFK